MDIWIAMHPDNASRITKALREFGQAFKRRTVDQIDGQTINLISLQDLKINKRAAGRPKDLDDLSKLSAKPKR